MKTTLTMLGFSLCLLVGCSGQKKQAETNFIQENIDNAVAQETLQTDIIEKSGKILNPRTIDKDGNIVYIPIDDWCSGFYPGNMWLTYELTGDQKWKTLAEKYTEDLDSVQYLTWHHDVGFMIGCSYLNGYRLANKTEYKPVIIQAAKSLSTRFRPGAQWVLHLCRSHPCRRPDRLVECLRQSRRQRLPQKPAHRNSQTQPPQDRRQSAPKHPAKHFQANDGHPSLGLADRRHGVSLKSPDGDVPHESEYAVPPIRAIHLQQSRHRVHDPEGGSIRRATGREWRRRLRPETARRFNGTGYAERHSRHPRLRTGRRCQHPYADAPLLALLLLCGH